MQQDNVLTLSGFRYLKLSLLVVLTCIVLYFADTPPIRPGGGTWLGYGLGTLGAVLIVWLMLFGLRKRAYSSNLGTVRGWLSAHVYLGLSLIVIATLHAAFHFGVNIHTLAYVLTLLVVFSGLWGLFGYMSIPSKMNGLLKGKTLDQSAEALTDIDTQSQRMVVRCPRRLNQRLKRPPKPISLIIQGRGSLAVLQIAQPQSRLRS